MITSDQLKDAKDRVEALHRYLDIDAKTMQLEEEQLRTQDPGFWDDAKRAEEQMKKVKGIEKWIVGYKEVKFGKDNEILLRGKTITPGYYKKESATKAAIDEEGWFHTGDAGYMKNGELFLTERIKDLFKTSNGKYIAPQMLESKLVIDRYIEQAVIVANEHKFVSALIVPDYKLLTQYAAEHQIVCSSREELCSHPLINKMMWKRIEMLQQDLAHYEQVKRFILLPAPFTMENDELTNTLKVKRRVVYAHYADKIEKMYADAEKEHQA